MCRWYRLGAPRHCFVCSSYGDWWDPQTEIWKHFFLKPYLVFHPMKSTCLVFGEVEFMGFFLHGFCLLLSRVRNSCLVRHNDILCKLNGSEAEAGGTATEGN